MKARNYRQRAFLNRLSEFGNHIGRTAEHITDCIERRSHRPPGDRLPQGQGTARRDRQAPGSRRLGGCSGRYFRSLRQMMIRQLSTFTLSMTGPYTLGLVVLENCRVVDGPLAVKMNSFVT
jgi:hypothetical protein